MFCFFRYDTFHKNIYNCSIHGNPIGDDGLKIIVQALCMNHNISTLDIGDCGLGDASVHYLKPLINPEEGKSGKKQGISLLAQLVKGL